METKSWIEIYVKDRGLVLREPAVIEYGENHRIEAMGSGVRESDFMSASVVYPFCDGKIKMNKEDFDAATKLIRYFVPKTYGEYCKKRLFHKFKVAVCMTSGAAAGEKQAMEDILYMAGAGKVVLTEQTPEEFMKSAPEKSWELLLRITG